MAHPIDIEKLVQGDLGSLARAITLVESQKTDHRKQATELINSIYNHRTEAIRIGITGIPGVGKSTFIESLGKEILHQGHRVAILAIDPSSSKSGGSILGDKTRMEELSRSEDAFIRPSPSGGTLGGIAARTRESMLLCEAAGFDVILIETVGVGQSETEVINITDCFLMLGMPGTGDDLQGIKRGIMEAADVIVINKADGTNIDAAKKAKAQLQMAMHLFPDSGSGWSPKVLTASGLNNEGVTAAWKTVLDMMTAIKSSGYFSKNRKAQQMQAFENLSELTVFEYVAQKLGLSKKVTEIRSQLDRGEINEYNASLLLLTQLNEI